MRSPEGITVLQMMLGVLAYLNIPAWPDGGTAIALVGGWGQIGLPWDDDIDLITDVEGKQQLLGLYGNRSRRPDDPAAGLVDLTGTATAAVLLLGAGQGQGRWQRQSRRRLSN